MEDTFSPQERAEGFGLMRKLGIVKAVCSFSGGNDEGGVHEITVTYEDGREEDFPVEYGDSMTYEGGKWTPVHWVDKTTGLPSNDHRGGHLEMVVGPTPRNEQQTFSLLLQKPVYAEYHSFAGEFYVDGTVTWDAKEGTVKVTKEESVMQGSEYEYDV